MGDMNVPRGIKMDESGRLIDEKGNVIEARKNNSLKINQKNERKRKARPILQIHRKAQFEKLKLQKSDYFDPELEIDKGNRIQRRKIAGLRFAEQGAHIKKAEAIRKKEITKQLGESDETPVEIQPAIDEQPDDLQSKVRRKISQMKQLDPIPDVEWWDTFLLPEGQKEFKFTDGQVEHTLTHYIQHPIPMKNPEMEKIKSMAIPIHLTEKERKRITKLKRAEKVKDRHEKIHLGLMEAPMPRLKMSSFMRAVNAQAVADPSAVEKEVKRQEAERQKAHIEHNENRKLTKKQRAEKFKSKLERDAKKEAWCALFRIKSLKDRSNLFKVDKNAKDWHLNGFLIDTEHLRKEGGGNFPNLVVVEGGKTAVKRYKKLLMRRIKWSADKGKTEKSDSESSKDDDNEPEAINNNNLKSTEDCALVWEGTLYKRSFTIWKHLEIKSEHEAIRALADKGCEHYWTHVINFKLENQ